jgi:hypothetical protein
MSGGINSALSGGDIGMGMITSAFSAGFAKYAGIGLFGDKFGGEGGLLSDSLQGMNKWGQFGVETAAHTVIGGVTGGLTAEIYGGGFGDGFKNGAVTASIGFMANRMSKKIDEQIRQLIKSTYSTTVSTAYGAVAAVATRNARVGVLTAWTVDALISLQVDSSFGPPLPWHTDAFVSDWFNPGGVNVREWEHMSPFLLQQCH